MLTQDKWNDKPRDPNRQPERHENLATDKWNAIKKPSGNNRKWSKYKSLTLRKALNRRKIQEPNWLYPYKNTFQNLHKGCKKVPRSRPQQRYSVPFCRNSSRTKNPTDHKNHPPKTKTRNEVRFGHQAERFEQWNFRRRIQKLHSQVKQLRRDDKNKYFNE